MSKVASKAKTTKMRATKKISKPRTKKAKVENMVFSQDLIVPFEKNMITRGNYSFSYTNGRSTYDISSFRFYDSKGVKIETSSILYKKYPIYAARVIVFKDILSIKVKKSVDLEYDEPFLISQSRGTYDKTLGGILYIPMRYLEELGYKIKTIKKTDKKHVTETKKILVTPYFEETLMSKETVDFEAQKKALINLLKTCKDRKEVALAVIELTNLRYKYSRQSLDELE